jgi:hypothetical protein
MVGPEGAAALSVRLAGIVIALKNVTPPLSVAGSFAELVQL